MSSLDNLRRRAPAFPVGSLVAALLLASPVHAGPAVDGSCPVATLRCPFTEQFVASARESVWCKDHAGYVSEVGFDLSQGRAFARGGHGSIQASDAYTIAGLPPGTEVRFAARVEPRVGACRGFDDGGSGLCTVSDSVNQVSLFTGTGPEDCIVVEDVLRLDLDKIAGAPFRLDLYARSDRGSTGGSGSASVRVTFVDLPPGGRITSCHGYVQDVPTSTRPAELATWGGIKSQYR